MNASQNAINIIKRFEGCRYNPYRDLRGLWTVGYGHLIGDGRTLPSEFARTFTQAEVDALLNDDITKFERGVDLLVTVPLTQNQFDALVSFSFNLGLGTLKQSTLLKKLNTGDTDGAAAEILKFHFAGPKSIPGLVARRQAEHDLFIEA